MSILEKPVLRDGCRSVEEVEIEVEVGVGVGVPFDAGSVGLDD